MAIAYGIDFGTSTSSIIIVDDKGTPTLVSDPESAQTIYTFPSSAYVNEDGRLLVGTAAERQKRLNLGAFRTQFKREFRSTVPRQLGGRTLRTDELVTALLARLRECALDRIPTRPSQVVITVPASWDEAQCDRMKDAAERAGFDPETVSLLPEPVAALRYAFDRDLLLAETTVLVYDLGGGTFDCVLARGNTAEGYTVVGRPGGCPDIGGIDFTTALMTKVAQGLAPRSDKWLDIDPADDAATRTHLNFRDQCEGAKCVLSKQPSTWLELPDGDQVEIDQEVLEDAIGEMLEETVAACEELLRAADLGWEDVKQVVPVGGSTKLTLIAKLLRDNARTVVKVDEPELAVVRGAALHAWDLLNGIDSRAAEEEPVVEGDEAADEAATHSTVPLPDSERRPEPELADLVFQPEPRRRPAPRPPRQEPTWVPAAAMLAGGAAVAGILKLGLLAYTDLGAFLDEHGPGWLASGWVAGITGTICMLAVFVAAGVVYAHIGRVRPDDLVSPWLTLMFAAVCGAVIWEHVEGWSGAAVQIALLFNLALIAYLVAVSHAADPDLGLGDLADEVWVGLIGVIGVAAFTWWSALSYGRLADYLEPRLFEFFATGWIGGIVGTLCIAGAIVSILITYAIMDEEASLDSHQEVFLLLCYLFTSGATVVAYNVPGVPGVVIAFLVANLAAAAFLVAATEV